GTVADGEQVVEVAADLVALTGRAVDDLDLDAVDQGQLGRQQAALERLADGGALRVQAGVVQGQCGPAGEVLGELQDLLAEVLVGRLAQREHADDAVAGDQRQDDDLAADGGGRGERGADAGGDAVVGAAAQPQAAHGGAQGRLVGDLAGRRPDAGAGRGDRIRRRDLRQQGLDAVDEFLVLVQHVGEVRLGRLVGDRVDGAPGGEGGDRHLGHEGQGLVAVEGAGEQVGRLDEEAQGAAAQPLQFAEAGRLDGQGDPVGRELQAQRLLVGVAAGCLGGDPQGAGETALDLQRDGDDGTHAGAVEEGDRAVDGGEVVVDGGHPGGAV